MNFDLMFLCWLATCIVIILACDYRYWSHSHLLARAVYSSCSLAAIGWSLLLFDSLPLVGVGLGLSALAILTARIGGQS